jgi:hypothetical protein
MFVTPNIPQKLHWFESRYAGDFDFLNGYGVPRRRYVWRDEIIVQLGHDTPSSLRDLGSDAPKPPVSPQREVI